MAKGEEALGEEYDPEVLVPTHPVFIFNVTPLELLKLPTLDFQAHTGIGLLGNNPVSAETFV